MLRKLAPRIYPHVLNAFAAASLFAALPASPAAAQSPTAKIVKAANTFLASLDAQQRTNAVFAYDDEAQRKRWSNFPTAIFKRAGVKLGDMNAAQREAAMNLLSVTLSKRGYEKTMQIVEADEVLKTTGGGRNLMFGKDEYYFAILGTPSEKTPWMLQFGGHHLGLNITVVGAQGVLTPSLTGAQPALYTLNGKTVRPLSGESDKAIALLNSLDETQRKQAILNYRVAEVVLGPGQDGKTIQPEGLKASAMNDKQRAALLDVMSEWAGIVHESAASARVAELKADINETWFAWSGPTTVAEGKNISGYYRIQGPHVVIEYAPQAMGGDPSMHVHAMYRDPTNDYGRKLTTK